MTVITGFLLALSYSEKLTETIAIGVFLLLLILILGVAVWSERGR